jgi:hypothetical protein
MLVLAVTACESVTAAPLIRGKSDPPPGTIITVEGSGTARTNPFTLDGSYDVDWTLPGDGTHACHPDDCYFSIELMTTGRDFLSNVTVVERYDPGSDVAPGWQRGNYFLYVYASDGVHWSVTIRDT